jgi:microcystin degradation protein MlrC
LNTLMSRVLIAGIAQEISSFNPVPTEYELFSIQRDAEVLDFNRNTSTAIAGAMDAFDNRPELEYVASFAAKAVSAGPMSADCWSRLSDEFLSSLRPHVGAVDAIYLALHGSMAGESELDPEGWILEQVRELFGAEIPVVFSLDLHGILTGKMMRNAEGVTSYHTYPHVDLYDTGTRAANLLLRILDGAAPVTVRLRVPAIVRGDELITETGSFGEQISEIKDLERSGEIMAGGFLIGNPFTDVPELCSQVFITTDGNPEVGEEVALKLAQQFWANRHKMQTSLVSIEEAVTQAFPLNGPVIFTDAADAPSSGAPGDSNALIVALRNADYPHTVLAPITDPLAVSMAVEAGIGGTFTAKIGGSMDPRFNPTELECKVKLLADGNYVLESWGVPQYSGPTAVVTNGLITLVITSRPVSLFDRSLFLGHGLDPQRFHSTVVKSPHCQPRFFDDWAEVNFNVDAPGSTSANLHSLGHTICERPIFPMEPDAEFSPTVEIYGQQL